MIVVGFAMFMLCALALCVLGLVGYWPTKPAAGALGCGLLLGIALMMVGAACALVAASP